MKPPTPAATISSQDLLACAVTTAKTAGTHALQNIGRRSEVHRTYRHDVKLQLDLECQELAIRTIHEHFPDHAILAEEDERHNREIPQGYQWIVDPIDGTVNFSHGFPIWCCSVAVRLGEKVLAGAIFAPALGHLYEVTHDGPALCDGENIHVSTVPRLDQAIIFTGMDKDAAPEAPPLTFFSAIAGAAQKARIIGSAALDLCAVACGQGDGYFESGIYLWDVAAAGLLVERAGGKTERLSTLRENRLCYMAGNGRINDELRTLLAENGLKKLPDGD